MAATTPLSDGAALAGAASGRRMLALVCAALVLSMTTWFSATAVTAPLAASFGLDEAQASWLTNAVQIGFVVGALGLSISGLVDRAPLHRIMAASAGLAALANLALLWAPGPASALLARFVTGLALAGIYPPALKLIATWYRRGRGLALGAVIGALTLGSALPHLLRALASGLDWRTVVASASALTLAGALLLGGFATEGPYAFARMPFRARQIGVVLRDRGLFLTNLGYFGHMWELYAMWSWFLAFAAHALPRSGLTDPKLPSLATFGVVAIGVVGCLLGGVLADRIGRTATTAGMMAVSGACAFLIGFTFDGPAWLFLLIGAVWGISVVGDSAQFSAMATEIGDPRLVGTALALQLGIGFALTVVAIRVLPLAVDAIGWQWSFLMLVPGPIIGVAAMLLLRRRPEAERIGGGLR
ncbi:MFS transporter [Methylobacterium nodulans]|uniref:Major facilitator superfamily MFS_1 n=1 Tax=Methylobacterium nodulans (strain LMG 21967 / CNCM I-2342 / ORS 2060) TaxID=460265 RepID=B8IGD3_METNO|nr:MFS transporter [Methylobacterium nodulans]ACL55833.1 major facilitator superfamily MFS_1 [Methylobacterium nodulans ORS 2060]